MAPLTKEDKFEKALLEVEKGVEIRKAARQYGINEKTLRDRLKKIKAGKDHKPRGSTTFSATQETMLANHCIHLAELGYGLARWQVIEVAKNMTEAIGVKRVPDACWFKKFVKRFPTLKLKQPAKTTKAKAALTADVVKNYFDSLEEIMTNLELKDIPDRIWNVDETGVSLDHNPPKVLPYVTKLKPQNVSQLEKVKLQLLLQL